MGLIPTAEPSLADESKLVTRACQGDEEAVLELLSPWRKPLFAYIHRMVTQRQDAEDLFQDVLVRVLVRLPSFRGDSRFKSWLFAIATHVCLDHLRAKRRWRVEAQLQAEERARSNPTFDGWVRGLLAGPGSQFDIREHITFCFSCLMRSLEPEEQAALMLREVLGFSGQEAADVMGVSEPVLRHRLSAARRRMIESYDGLCQLISKEGACWQCRGLREAAPPAQRGPELLRIEVGPGVAVTPESLFQARLEIVRDADLETGRSQALHDGFFAEITGEEEGSER